MNSGAQVGRQLKVYSSVVDAVERNATRRPFLSWDAPDTKPLPLETGTFPGLVILSRHSDRNSPEPEARASASP